MTERSPYKYLDYYTFEDADLFFGREEETQKMVGEILSTRLLVLFSPSGSGKTSLINAGVRPALEKLGYKTVYVRLESDPIPSVQSAVALALSTSDFVTSDTNTSDLHNFLQQATINARKPLVVFIDQFEEFFIVFKNHPELQQQFIEQVAKIKYDDQLPVFLVLSLREDYYASLHEFRSAIPSIFQNNANIRLEPFIEAEARRAIEEPAKVVGCEYEAGLVERMLQDLKNGKPGIEPITLQIVCNTLWREKPSHETKMTFANYKASGGAEYILRNYVFSLLDALSWPQQRLMARIFEALKTPDNTKRYCSLEDLQVTSNLNLGRLKQGLAQLIKFNILRQEQRAGRYWYEFKHDYLVHEVTKWIQRHREKLYKRKWRVNISIIIALCIALVYSWRDDLIQYNSFYAGFINPKYSALQEEIVISRWWNPSRETFTTGLLREDVRTHEDINILREYLNLGIFKKNDWKLIANRLNLTAGGKFLYRIGHEEMGIDSLIAALEDQDDYNNVRTQAVDILVKLGQKDGDVIAALLRMALEEQSLSIRVQAASILVKLGQNDESMTAILIRALRDQSLSVRAQAIAALSEIKSSNNGVIKALVTVLKDQEPYIRAQAATALGKIRSSNDEVIAALVNALNDQESDVWIQAVNTLFKLGRSNDNVIMALEKMLKDQSSNIRVRAASAGTLVKLGLNNEIVITTLLAALKDQDRKVRTQALSILGEIRPNDALVINALIEILKDKDQDSYSRVLAAGALVNSGQNDKNVMAALLAVLKDEKNGSVRAQIAGTLGETQANNEQAIAALNEALKDEEWNVRTLAASALIKLGLNDERVTNVLITALQNEEWNVRLQAGDALAEIKINDQRVIDALVEALKDEEWNVREQAVYALGTIKTNDERVINAMVAALRDQDKDVRTKAAVSLGKLERIKPLPQLLAQLAHPLSGYRTAAAQALAQKDIPIDSTLQVIAKLRDDKRPWGRLGAWEAYELLEQRREAVQKFLELLHEADSLFASGQLSVASGQYESAFETNLKVTPTDSLNAAHAKFQQARCAAKLKRVVPALDDLKIAFEYNPTLRETLQAEMAKPENDWKIFKGNWYLREVLFKKR